MSLAQTVPTAPFSTWTLSVLTVVFALSWLVLFQLMRLWTLGRRRQRLRQWAATHDARPTRTVPGPLLGSHATFRVLAGYASEEVLVFHLKSDRTPGSRSPRAQSAWNVLAVRLAVDPGFSGLRPAAARVSLVDLFSVAGDRPNPDPKSAVRLLSYPSIDPSAASASGDAAGDFTLFAESDAAAEFLAATSLPARLPPDVGVLLRDGWLILDFSPRPFTETALTPLLKLARELAGKLTAKG